MFLVQVEEAGKPRYDEPRDIVVWRTLSSTIDFHHFLHAMQAKPARRPTPKFAQRNQIVGLITMRNFVSFFVWSRKEGSTSGIRLDLRILCWLEWISFEILRRKL